MNNGIGKQTAKSAKQMAQAIAKQMAQEPMEVLRTARSQVTGTESSAPKEQRIAQAAPIPQEPANKQSQNSEAVHDQLVVQRRMEALNRELEDMHKQTLFKELQEKIVGGEDVPIEDYGELSMEQKQVLKAQKEAVQKQVQGQQIQKGNALPMPSSKRSRRFGPSRKQEAEKQQQRVEKPVPPSG